MKELDVASFEFGDLRLALLRKHPRRGVLGWQERRTGGYSRYSVTGWSIGSGMSLIS